MTSHLLMVIGVMAAATIVCRAAPFLFLGEMAELPAVRYLGRGIPPVILTLLVVYCLRQVDLTEFPYGLNEGLALAATVAMHLIFRSALLSIAIGTGVYMSLLQSGFLSTLG